MYIIGVAVKHTPNSGIEVLQASGGIQDRLILSHSSIIALQCRDM